MNNFRTDRLEANAKVFKALAHPTRLLIVEEIAAGEKCVCELTDLVGNDVSTVSKHLSVLKNAGVVKDEKRGSLVYYRLVMPCVLNFFSCIAAALESRARDQLGMIRGG